MTDRELLELAAKAAGLLVQRDETYLGVFTGLNIRIDDCPGGYRWNPLIDDGDALRLAVKLDMVVTVNRVDEWTQAKCGYFVNEMRLTNEPHGSDPYAATRRAIVRAAARRIILLRQWVDGGGT